MDKPVTLIIGLGKTVGESVARRFLDEGHAVLAVDPDTAALDELREGLSAAEQLLRSGGKLAVVSFHSLEDRIVKRFLRDASGRNTGSRYLPETEQQPAIFTQISKAIRPSDAEIARNPRARSSTLRHAVRSDTPARKVAA